MNFFRGILIGLALMAGLPALAQAVFLIGG